MARALAMRPSTPTTISSARSASISAARACAGYAGAGPDSSRAGTLTAPSARTTPVAGAAVAPAGADTGAAAGTDASVAALMANRAGASSAAGTLTAGADAGSGIPDAI